MTLSALIHGNALKDRANANSANPANEADHRAGRLARLATLALASPADDRTEGAEPDPPAPAVDLDALLAEACQSVECIDSAAFRALLSPEDVDDIEGGHIPVVTLNAYARSFAEGIRAGRIAVLAAAIPRPATPSGTLCRLPATSGTPIGDGDAGR